MKTVRKYQGIEYTIYVLKNNDATLLKAFPSVQKKAYDGDALRKARVSTSTQSFEKSPSTWETIAIREFLKYAG